MNISSYYVHAGDFILKLYSWDYNSGYFILRRGHDPKWSNICEQTKPFWTSCVKATHFM